MYVVSLYCLMGKKYISILIRFEQLRSQAIKLLGDCYSKILVVGIVTLGQLH